MKAALLACMALTLVLACRGFSGCAPGRLYDGDAAVKEWYVGKTDSLLLRLNQLGTAANSRHSLHHLKALFAECRYNYKRTEAITEYFFQGLVSRVNGPALPDVRVEDGRVWPPHGFQVIEQLLWDGYHDSLASRLSAEIGLLQADLRFMQAQLQHQSLSTAHVSDLLRHQFIRMAVLGMTGFDAPLSTLSLPELQHSLHGVREIAMRYTGNASPGMEQDRLMAEALAFLELHTDFDSFDRLDFLRKHLMPLSDSYEQLPGVISHRDSTVSAPFSGSLRQLLQGSGFNADHYAGYEMARSNEAKIALGRKLFSDGRLSRSGEMQCASCHQPARYFTDGRAKAADFAHGGSLSRNTPSILYSGLQSHQFYDLRSVSLEGQADEVMSSRSEFDCPAELSARKLATDQEYLGLFRRAFDDDSLSGYKLRNALAAYLRSLSPFNSAFDAYMTGADTALSGEQKLGFNLFTGKARCGTCHFMPLFNGTIPPWFTRSESEILGVPSTVRWQAATLDADSGRYKVHRLPALLFSFKTPTVRNAAKTAPYMHNGVYRTLDEVVEFYHKGGGAGLGIELATQSLPKDSLPLNAAEKKAIVRFLEALTDAPTFVR